MFKSGVAQAKAPSQIANPLPDPKKLWQIYEEEYFVQPLELRSRAFTETAKEFELAEIVLAKDSVYARSREWNRSFMLRIGVDRLLHNFRLTAGLESSAVPLGGLEAPTSELRGYWAGHYLSA